MRTQSLSKLVALCTIALAISLTTSRAQIANATWIGPSSGGEWNTPADWDIGVPAEGTNVLIGFNTNVNYNIPMAATSFGILTNNGVLNINAAGFNCFGIVMPTNGSDRVFLNNGAVVSVFGNILMSTNSSMTMTAGSSLTVNGGLNVSFGTSSKAAGLSSFTNSGGALSTLSTAINNNQGTENALLVISGGTNNLGTTIIGRSSTSSFQALGAEGLAIYGGVVTTTNLNVGNNGQGVSYLSAYIAGGTVTNQGAVFINQGTAGRASRLIQAGGLFVVPDPNVVNPNSTVAATSIYSVTGGTNIVGGFFLGNSNNAATATINVTNNAIIYVASQGIATNGAATINVSLGNGGLFGATAPWTGNAAMKLPSGMFTFQTADMSGNPNGITLSNALTGSGGVNKTGSGTLTFDATNTYVGNTMINAGTLAVGGTGAILNSLFIFVSSGALMDVSQNSSYFVNPGQTLAGFGTVAGAVNVSSNGIVFPGSNSITGTLTFSGSLNETGGAINQFQLSSNPSGPNNDHLTVSGGLNASGVNYILVNGSAQIGGIYPLISYSGGGFSGSLANFAVSPNGASGVLSNSASAQIIYFIPQTIIRGNTNITWVGSVPNNNWDVETTSNWVDGNSANKDYFVPGDNVLFGNLEATNVINVPGSVLPAAVTVSTTTNYTLTGGGTIDGTGGITVSNGTVNMLLTNNYTGPTVLDGGVLSIPGIANGGSPSPIGAALPSEPNIVLNGGTLAYTGPSASTDRGMTLTNGGGVFDITNGTVLTLAGDITGPGPLRLQDSGNVIMAFANTYTNSTTIAGTILQLNNGNGAGSGPIVFSNATLLYNPSAGIDVPNAFSFVAGTTNLIGVRSGSGGNPLSDGAWTGGGVVLVSNMFNPFTVNGNLNGFTGTIVLDTPNATAFRFNSSGNSCVGSTNATFDLSNTNAILVSRNNGVMSLGALQGALGAQISGPSSTAGTVIWSIGANNLSTTYGGLIADGPTPANEKSGLAKVGTGTLTLVGGVETVLVGLFEETLATNLLEYTGPTTISNGVLAVVVPDNLTLSPNVTLASSSAVFDASDMGFIDDTGTNLITNGVFEVVSGQTLNGIGTIRGTVITDPGSTFNVGLPGTTGTMTVTNAVSLGGTIRLKLNRPASDELISGSSITNGGSLIVTNIGGALQGGDTFTLFSATSYIGTFSSVTLPALSGSQSWDTSQLYSNGKISVVGSAAPPGFSSIHTSGNDIVLNATGGTPNGPVTVLSSTNLLIPLNQWSTVTTGNFDNSGNFTYTVTGALISGLPQQFYILAIP